MMLTRTMWSAVAITWGTTQANDNFNGYGDSLLLDCFILPDKCWEVWRTNFAQLLRWNTMDVLPSTKPKCITAFDSIILLDTSHNLTLYLIF